MEKLLANGKSEGGLQIGLGKGDEKISELSAENVDLLKREGYWMTISMRRHKCSCHPLEASAPALSPKIWNLGTNAGEKAGELGRNVKQPPGWTLAIARLGKWLSREACKYLAQRSSSLQIGNHIRVKSAKGDHWKPLRCRLRS